MRLEKKDVPHSASDDDNRSWWAQDDAVPHPVFDDTGPSSSQSPYVVPVAAGVQARERLRAG
jgi:hypothetical protein